MTAEGAVVLIWVVTLIVALVLTVGLVGMIVRTVMAAREVDRLLKETVPPAVGIVESTAAIHELETVVAAAGPLLNGVASIKQSTEGIREKVGRVGAMLAAGARP